VLRNIGPSFSGFLFAILLVGCASDRQFRSAEPVQPPRFLELQEEQSIATVHFPAGLYSLDSIDDTGSYYRMTRQLVKHSFAGPLPQTGGIFVGKSNRKLRGYIVWAGGLTKIGSLSPNAIRFRN
jgi:hypothetical protein